MELQMEYTSTVKAVGRPPIDGTGKIVLNNT